MKKILITGGTGALGRALVRYLSQNSDIQIMTLSRNFVQSSGNHIHEICDIADYLHLNDIFDRFKPDIIFHLATAFSGDLEALYTMNVQHSKHLLELIKHKNKNVKIILIGSAAEYGCVKTHENPIQENRVLAPVSNYGVTKAWQTQLLNLYQSMGVEVMCARIFNLFGEGISEHLFFGRLQNQIDEVLAGKKTVIQLGDLSATRDYISTEEAARQLFAIAKQGVAGEIYHVASGVPTTILALLTHQLEKVGLNLDIVENSKAFSNHKGFDIPVIYADISKIKNLLAQEVSHV